jgi:UDP-2-acetamido-2-deoxy-ribo-hexuluronate aminotransferase
MRFIDLGAQQQRIRKAIEDRIRAVLDHGQYIMGPEITAIEKKLAEYVGVEHAVGCSSGTDALVLTLMAYDVGPGDAVITTPFTFMATAEAIALAGATPIFTDVDPVTFNMDPAGLEQAIRAARDWDKTVHPLPGRDFAVPPRLKAVMPVDLFGIPADYARINALARDNGLLVIEDAAQSFGGEVQGRKTCALAEAACTSFFPAKPLGAYGDGGMIFTDDGLRAARMRSLLVHGQGRDKYENVEIGINGRLDTLQAAVLLAKFEIFPEELLLRERVASQYAFFLDHASSAVRVPTVPEGCRSAWAQYSVLASDEAHRAHLLENLGKAGVPTAIYYPRPLHLQPAFGNLGYRQGDFPVSEACANRIFSLPMHPYLDPEDQERIARIIVAG